jgi:Resolvase, N terminal domain
VLEFLHGGDVLMVIRIDRLARSIGDLQDIVRTVRGKGASLKATEQPIDTSTAAGKCFLDMLGVFAEFETNLRRERQLEARRPHEFLVRRIHEHTSRGDRPLSGAGINSRWFVSRICGQRLAPVVFPVRDTERVR